MRLQRSQRGKTCWCWRSLGEPESVSEGLKMKFGDSNSDFGDSNIECGMRAAAKGMIFAG